MVENKSLIVICILSTSVFNTYANNKKTSVKSSWQKIAESEPISEEEQQIRLGKKLLQFDRIDDALTQFKQALKDNPQNGKAHYHIGTIYQNRKDHHTAIDHLEKAQKLNIDLPAERQLAICYQAQGWHQKAIRAYNQALQKDPYDLNARQGLADAYTKSKQWRLAEQEYRKAIKQDPNNLQLQFELANTLKENEKSSEADQIIAEITHEVTKLNPSTKKRSQSIENTSSGVVTAEVQIGELVDKMTILEIKAERISDMKKLKNIKAELAVLQETYDTHIVATEKLQNLTAQLKKVNEQLWEIEDDIRDQERNKTFDKEFIKLARSVYYTNDERCKIKRQINELCGSRLIEEKSYAKYA